MYNIYNLVLLEKQYKDSEIESKITIKIIFSFFFIINDLLGYTYKNKNVYILSMKNLDVH